MGFRPDLGAGNDPLALAALSSVFALAPAFLGLAGAALISGHTMDKAAHDAIRQQLDARDAIQKERATA